ncbi:LLM class F420-dependent oxidoreductase [Streptomyces sp. NPDC051664]|uniref:LLM class F420-dependent oxidoreductase n=1 Tax=Streptomyces sp. NPDC051664 TaxID=3365668 RepID=UPI0037A161C4
MTFKNAIGHVGIFTHELRAEDPALTPTLLEAAGMLEHLGFGAIWLGGNSDVRHAERLVTATSRIVVATGITNIWHRPASVVAEDRARLNSTHPGRFLLGLGASHAELTPAYRRPYSAMQQYLDGLDSADHPVTPRARVLAALGPKMLELSRDRAAGAIPYLVTPEFTAAAREILGAEPLLAPEVGVVLEHRAERARPIAREFLRYYLQLPNYIVNLKRLGFDDEDFQDAGSDQLVDSLVIWGNDEEIRRRIHDFHAAGADHVAVQVLTSGHETVPLTQWKRLAEVTL